MKLTSQIAKNVRDVHFGGNWAYSNLKDNLADITWKEANEQVHSLNSITSMIYHIHFYVVAVSKVLHEEILDAKDSRSWESTAVKSKAELDNIRRKSIEMSEYFIRIFDDEVKALGYKLSSPLNTEQRGSRISISHEESFRITKALMDR